MRVQFTRDSVAAGDDADAPHSLGLEFAEDTSLEQMLQAALSEKYLPTISGGKATWSVTSQKPLAVVAQQWNKPKLLFQAEPQSGWLITNQILQLHFNYHTQQEPEQVFSILSSLRLL